jgi:hypothetical protein
MNEEKASFLFKVPFFCGLIFFVGVVALKGRQRNSEAKPQFVANLQQPKASATQQEKKNITALKKSLKKLLSLNLKSLKFI